MMREGVRSGFARRLGPDRQFVRLPGNSVDHVSGHRYSNSRIVTVFPSS